MLLENQNKGLRSAYAVAFTCMVAFMGIGLVDPILKTIAVKLNATPAQTTLLFTSYMLVTGIIMLFTGFISTRIGAKKTISIGLIIIVLFAALAGRSQTISINLPGPLALKRIVLIDSVNGNCQVMPENGTSHYVIRRFNGNRNGSWSVSRWALGSFSWRFPFYGAAINVCR